MTLRWLLNGTLEAHHLAAAYLTVWLVQGGYAAWIVREMLRTRADLHKSTPAR